MVVKNRGLYLGLLVSLLGVGNVMQAYKLTVENRTKFKLKFYIKYFLCRHDKGEVAPRSISSVIRTGACSVLSVSAWVGPRSMNIKGQSYIPSVGKAANSTFVVYEYLSNGRLTLGMFRVKYRSRFKS